MIIQYDQNPSLNTDQKLKSLKESVQMALTEAETNAQQAHDKLNAAIQKNVLVDLFYPVGTWYSTSDAAFNPNKVWGGNWELLEEGRVLLSAGQNYTAGRSYGNNSPTLTDNQIAHKHDFTNPKIPNHHHAIPGNWSTGSGSTTAYMTTANRSATTRTTSTDGGGGVCSGGDVHRLGATTRSAYSTMQLSTAAYLWHRTA